MRIASPLFLSGLIVMAGSVVISLLSRDFIFGVHHAQRPILAFLGMIALIFGAYWTAIEWIRRQAVTLPWAVGWIIFISIICRIIFIPSNMIQETDPYRYVWDGQQVLSLHNPYLQSPREAYRGETELSQFRSSEATAVYEKINHPTVKTIYPPAAQLLFAVAQRITPWSLKGWRLLVFLADLAVLWFLLLILKRAGIHGEWILLYGWSPLILKEFHNSLHVDVFVVLSLTGMLYATGRGKIKTAFICIAMASLLKFFAVGLVPFLFLWGYKKDHKQTWSGLGCFMVVAAVFYGPFLGAGGALFEGLSLFAHLWHVNAGLFSVMDAGVKSIPFLSPAQVGWASRLLAALFLAALFLKLFLNLKKTNHFEAFSRSCLILIAGLFFLAPTGNPWYFTWIYPFLFFLPLRAFILFSGLVFLYYLDFYFNYQGSPERFTLVRWVEYGTFYLFLGSELWFMRRQSR